MQVDNLEKNKVKLTFEVDAERFEEGMKHSYNKNKGRINISGFRKGKAPRKLIEIQYGKEIFYDDAIDYVLDDAYKGAISESNLDVVSKPSIDVVEVSAEKGVVFTAEVYIKPEVKVNDYKGVTYKKIDSNVTEEEIQKEIEATREKNSRLVTITDRNVEDGDIVTIDFKGYLGDEPFEGGEGKDYELKIGSHSFIDTFEQQLIGKAVGDDVIVNVTFPEEYHEENLKGKPAKFEVEIKDIKVKELPEVNDEFAQDVSEFDTLEEYKQNIKNTLEEVKKADALREKENEVMKKIIENSEMDVPQVMIDQVVDQQVGQFLSRIKQQGIPVDMYLQFAGQTMETLREAHVEGAELQVKGRLALEAIAELENLQATEDEVNEEIERIANMYAMDVDTFKGFTRDSDLRDIGKDIIVRKALKIVTDSAIETE